MKKDFEWYFQAEDLELAEIWKTGTLTLDTNVLLDLYRYHEDTRNEILKAIRKFEGRLWISRQAAEEFFRNRSKVIIDSTNGFKDAEDNLEKLEKSIASTVNQLRSNRIIPKSIAEDLEEALANSMKKSRTALIGTKSSFPDYLTSDPVLDELLHLFEGAVGPEYTEDQRKVAVTEAERRKKYKIPPGYLDDKKEGEGAYGDYLVWRQILEHSKSSAKPMLLVTSERKDDWWERVSGRTVGPRQELQREAYEFAEQRILIYQTERFLQFSAKSAGVDVAENVMQEILALSEFFVDEDSSESKDGSTFTVDARDFLAREDAVFIYPFSAFETLGSLIDDIYFKLSEKAKPFQYGTLWVLKNKSTGALIKTTRMLTNTPPGQPIADLQSLSDVGIYPGCTLVVEFPRQ